MIINIVLWMIIAFYLFTSSLPYYTCRIEKKVTPVMSMYAISMMLLYKSAIALMTLKIKSNQNLSFNSNPTIHFLHCLSLYLIPHSCLMMNRVLFENSHYLRFSHVVQYSQIHLLCLNYNSRTSIQNMDSLENSIMALFTMENI